MDRRTAELLEHSAVRRLQDRYADAVTRRAWSEVAAMFVRDAVITLDLRESPPIELVGGDAIAGLIAGACERFEFFELTMLNAVVDLDDGLATAHGRIWQCEVRQEAASGRHTLAFGVYRDEYVASGGEWRFARRRYSSLARTPNTAEAPGLDLFPMPAWDRRPPAR